MNIPFVIKAMHDAGITHRMYQTLSNVIPEMPRTDHIKEMNRVIKKDALAEDTHLKESFKFKGKFLSYRMEGIKKSRFSKFPN